MRPPYDGAKNYFFIEDVGDRDYLSELVTVTCKKMTKVEFFLLCLFCLHRCFLRNSIIDCPVALRKKRQR